MKKPLIHLIVLVFSCLGLGAAEDWHTFTDKGGRSFVGSVISVDEDAEKAVVLTKTSGRHSEIDFRILSESDISYLQDWRPQKDEPEGIGSGEESDSDLGEASSRLYPKTKEEIRERLREIEARDEPKGISGEQQETINRLNIYRYLSGVPYDVAADEIMVAQAKDAAEACEKHGGLSHALGHSTDICNLASGGSMLSSVKQYITDSGENNRERRGHRRWCLNPRMGKTGFGSSGIYSAMVAMDSSGSGKTKDSWAYPGKGFFPKEYLHGNGWTLYLTENAPPKDEIKVEVYKLSKRPEKPFSSSEEIPGTALPVEYGASYGNAINFEPQFEPITGRGIYWVRVTGGGLREGYVVELY